MFLYPLSMRPQIIFLYPLSMRPQISNLNVSRKEANLCRMKNKVVVIKKI